MEYDPKDGSWWLRHNYPRSSSERASEDRSLNIHRSDPPTTQFRGSTDAGYPVLRHPIVRAICLYIAPPGSFCSSGWPLYINGTHNKEQSNRFTGVDWRPVGSGPARLVATAAPLCECPQVSDEACTFAPRQSCLVALAGHLGNPNARPAQPTDLQGAHNKLALARKYREHATVTPTSRKRTSRNPPSCRRLPVSYPGVGCASNGLQSTLMRTLSHVEKTGMCTRPPTGSLAAS